jgi:hypothetical protein
MSMAHEDHSAQLSVEQFKSLRYEIEEAIRHTRNLELYAIAAVAAYYAWMLTHCIPSVQMHLPIIEKNIESRWIAWFIPVSIPILGAWRVWFNLGQILVVANYIAKIEETFDGRFCPLGPDKGWENYLRIVRSKRKPWDEMSEGEKRRQVGMGVFFTSFWLSLFLFILVMIVLGFFISNKQTCP